MNQLSLMTIALGICGMVYSLPQDHPSFRAPPPTVEELNIPKYLGQWKQVRNKPGLVILRNRKHLVCVW